LKLWISNGSKILPFRGRTYRNEAEQIQRILPAPMKTPSQMRLEKLRRPCARSKRSFPTERLAGMTLIGDIWFRHGNFQKSRALAKSPQEQSGTGCKGNVSMLLKQLSHEGKPVDLKFSALDGREVDLKKLRGKVVLIDFWRPGADLACANCPM